MKPKTALRYRPLLFSLTLLALITACGPRGSGYAPAQNAVSATPHTVIDLQTHDYELPEAEAPAEGLFASYATGDSSGGRIYSIPGLSEPLQDIAADTESETHEAAAENEGESDLFVLGDETSAFEEETGEDDNAESSAAENEEDMATDAEEADTQAADAEDDASGSEEAETDAGDAEATDDTSGDAEADNEENTEATEAESEADSSEDAAAESEAASEDSAESDDAAAAEGSEVLAQGSAFDWQALGEETYVANCVACHQANGQGIPGAFPPLAGHLPELYNAEGGRDYLISVVLYGLQGEIDVNGTTYNGVMTPWGQLSDEQIAATLNHELTSWDNEGLLEDFSPLQPAEVADLRGQDLSSSDVYDLRPELP